MKFCRILDQFVNVGRIDVNSWFWFCLCPIFQSIFGRNLQNLIAKVHYIYYIFYLLQLFKINENPTIKFAIHGQLIIHINLCTTLSNFVMWYFSVMFSSQVQLKITFTLERSRTKCALVFLCVGFVTSFVRTQIIFSLELFVTEYACELGILLQFLNENS